MADIYTRDQLKAWFKTGAKPTQSHFAALIDSLRHMDDTIDATAVAGLEDLLYTITDQEIATNLAAHNASTSSHNLGTVAEFAAALGVSVASEGEDGIDVASLDDESAAIPDESVTPSAAEIAAEAAKVAEEAAKLTAESTTDEPEATTDEE